MKLRWLQFVLILLAWIGWAVSLKPGYAAEDVSATLTASQPTLTVGDVVTLTLQVTHTAGADLLPLAPERTWGAFEVRSLSPVLTQSNDDGSEISRQQIGVTLWMTGTYGTPPLTIKLVGAQGNQQELTVQPITLTVTSVLTGTNNTLHDLKPQATLPIPPLWPWILGGCLGVLLIGSGGWRLYRRWRTRPVVAPMTIPDLRPAYQIALDELAQVQQLQLPAQRRFKEHYTLATDVLRRYLAGAFGIPAIDQTTSEVRQALKQSAITPEQKSRLLEMLNEADLVKFAGVTPVDGGGEQLVANARDFVLATKPIAPIAPTSTGGAKQSEVGV